MKVDAGPARGAARGLAPAPTTPSWTNGLCAGSTSLHVHERVVGAGGNIRRDGEATSMHPRRPGGRPPARLADRDVVERRPSGLALARNPRSAVPLLAGHVACSQPAHPRLPRWLVHYARSGTGRSSALQPPPVGSCTGRCPPVEPPVGERHAGGAGRRRRGGERPPRRPRLMTRAVSAPSPAPSAAADLASAIAHTRIEQQSGERRLARPVLLYGPPAGPSCAMGSISREVRGTPDASVSEREGFRAGEPREPLASTPPSPKNRKD